MIFVIKYIMLKYTSEKEIIMDSFIEYMIKRKKNKKAILESIAVVFAAFLMTLVLTFAFLFIVPQALGILPMLIFAVFYLAYRIIASFDLEYEYILTNGELDIDKIINKKSRKRLITVHCKSFIAFAKVGSGVYANEENSTFSKVITANANSDSYDDYFAVFYINGQKMKLIFNPTQKMIDVFKIYAPRVVK